MTCIVGLVDNGRVYIGGDSSGVDEHWNLTIRADKKVFRKEFGDFFNRDGLVEEMLIGFTSSFRMGQLLQYRLDLPILAAQPTDQLFQYMTTIFVDAVRHYLKEGGFAEKDKEAEKGGAFLVGYRGRLFCIESDYQVAEAEDGFYAVGYGAPVALGALYATRGMALTPYVRISLALSAAEHFNIGVRGPFTIISSKEAQLDPR